MAKNFPTPNDTPPILPIKRGTGLQSSSRETGATQDSKAERQQPLQRSSGKERERESVNERKEAVTPAVKIKKMPPPELLRGHAKAAWVEGDDGVWRIKSGYAFSPLLTDKLDRIRLNYKQQVGEDTSLQRWIEMGMERIIREYSDYL